MWVNVHSSNLLCDFVAHEMTAKKWFYCVNAIEHEKHYFSIYFFTNVPFFSALSHLNTKLHWKRIEKLADIQLPCECRMRMKNENERLYQCLTVHHHITQFTKLIPHELIEVYSSVWQLTGKLLNGMQVFCGPYSLPLIFQWN